MQKRIDQKFGIIQTDKETLAKWFHILTLSRILDEKAPNYLKQAIGWSYHAPAAGHDGIQLAIGQVFEKKKDQIILVSDMVHYDGDQAPDTLVGGLASLKTHLKNLFA